MLAQPAAPDKPAKVAKLKLLRLVFASEFTSVTTLGDWFAVLNGLHIIVMLFVSVAQPADKCHNICI